jgi:hypothetical protein
LTAGARLAVDGRRCKHLSGSERADGGRWSGGSGRGGRRKTRRTTSGGTRGCSEMHRLLMDRVTE